jgi:hypothetical protein
MSVELAAPRPCPLFPLEADVSTVTELVGSSGPKAEVAGEAYAPAATGQFAETPMASKAASIVA